MRVRALRLLAAAGLAAAVLPSLPGVPAAAATGDGTASLAGRVRSAATGAPLAGVCVTAARGIDLARRTVTATTDAAGAYTLTGLPAGGYVVAFNVCSAPLAGFAAAWYPGSAAAPVAAEPVALAAGEQRTGVDADLGPGAALQGVLRDSTGAALAGDCLEAYDPTSGVDQRTRAAADGRFVVGGLPPGRYGLSGYDCTPPYTHVAVQPGRVVDLAAGTVSAENDLTLALGGEITGRLTAAHTGRPAAFVCAVLFTADTAGTLSGTAATGLAPDGAFLTEPGTFVLGGVPPGDYQLLLGFDWCTVHDGYAESWYRSVPNLGGDPRTRATVIHVAAGQVVSGVDDTVEPERPDGFTGYPLVCLGAGPAPYSDVADSTGFRDEIGCAAAAGFVRGDGSGRFRPAQAVTRGEAAGILARALAAAGAALPAAPPAAFRDTSGADGLAADQLAALGVVSGSAAGVFAPAVPVTRGQLALMLARAYRAVAGFGLLAGADAFADDDGTVYEPADDQLFAARLMLGVGAGRFDPGGRVTRAAMAGLSVYLVDRLVRDTGYGVFDR